MKYHVTNNTGTYQHTHIPTLHNNQKENKIKVLIGSTEYKIV